MLALRDKTSKLYQDLSTHLGKDLDDYIMETEVQLYINQKDYMVADAVLIKRDLKGDILDVILIENKLSLKTRFTQNQDLMIKLIKLKGSLGVRVRSLERSIAKDELLPLSSGNLVQIRGNGTTDISTVQINHI